METTQPSISKTDRVYLPGLDALRFFAAFSVIIGHVELLKSQLYVANYAHLFEKINFGGLGVYFFFVLSGFLITYLLIHEKEKTGTIAIKQFYIRRILRIWPLYYLIAFLGLFVFPHFEALHIPWLQQYFAQNFTANLILFILMLPNIAFSFMPALPHAGQLWSIGVEEQFYLIWPVLVKKTKKLLHLILRLLFLILLVKALYVILMQIGIIPQNYWTAGIKRFLAMSKFECMLIGAWGAYLVKNKMQNWLDILYHPAVLGGSLALLPFLSYFAYDYELLNNSIHLIYAILFLVIILNVSTNPKSFLQLENPIFSFLGRISYGLYMYHMFLIVLLIQLGKQFLDPDETLFNVYLYLFTIVASIAIATASYYWFEKPFLTLKNKYTIVKSGKS